MSGYQNMFQNNGFQQPIFAPASTQGAQLCEDLDLNEIFNDYFHNDTDDSANANNSMFGFYSGAAAALAQQASGNVPTAGTFQQSLPHSFSNTLSAAGNSTSATTSAVSNAFDSMPIPTGGIKTAWHSGSLPILTGVNQQQQYSHMPTAKKHKGMDHEQEMTAPTTAMTTDQQNFEHLKNLMTSSANDTQILPPSWMNFNAMNEKTTNGISKMHEATNGSATITTTAINNAFNVNANAIPTQLNLPFIGGQLSPKHQSSQQSLELASASANGSNQSSQSNVLLPVGVGLRLGGMGGIVAPGQSSTSDSTLNPTQQWNTKPPPQASQSNNETNNTISWPTTLNFDVASLQACGLSEKVLAQRRLRNREHAKRSRVRKKFLLESLQEQVGSLQKENAELRMIVQEKIPDHAQQIIADCCQQNPLFADSEEKTTKKKVGLVKSDFSLVKSLSTGQQNFVLSDPRLPDNPIVFASEGFYELTGYTRDQVLGRNCRFLQGPGTDPRAVEVIRAAIKNGTDATVCILNYKADGTPFWNQFFVAALRDAENNIVNYVGVQCHIEPEAGSTALEDKVNQVMPLNTKEQEEEDDDDDDDDNDDESQK